MLGADMIVWLSAHAVVVGRDESSECIRLESAARLLELLLSGGPLFFLRPCPAMGPDRGVLVLGAGWVWAIILFFLFRELATS